METARTAARAPPPLAVFAPFAVSSLQYGAEEFYSFPPPVNHPRFGANTIGAAAKKKRKISRGADCDLIRHSHLA